MKTAALIFLSLLAGVLGRTIGRHAIIEQRVINGEEAKLGERPFQVSLQSNGAHFCGGSIVNNYWIVTAGHCVRGMSPSSIVIFVGTVDRRKPHSVHLAVEIISHENYDAADSYRNDIALIKVATPFEFSFQVQPVALPEPHVVVKTNSSAVLSGWGRLLSGYTPIELQKVSIYIADPVYCDTVMREKNYRIYPTNICANDPTERKGQCNGDSGGPLTVDGKLAGIVSWSIKDPVCASTKYPGVYTRVSEYVEWIKENAKV